MGVLYDWYITTGNAGRLCVLPERMMKNRESLRHIKCTGIVDAVEQLKNYEEGGAVLCHANCVNPEQEHLSLRCRAAD